MRPRRTAPGRMVVLVPRHAIACAKAMARQLLELSHALQRIEEVAAGRGAVKGFLWAGLGWTRLRWSPGGSASLAGTDTGIQDSGEIGMGRLMTEAKASAATTTRDIGFRGQPSSGDSTAGNQQGLV